MLQIEYTYIIDSILYCRLFSTQDGGRFHIFLINGFSRSARKIICEVLCVYKLNNYTYIVLFKMFLRLSSVIWSTHTLAGSCLAGMQRGGGLRRLLKNTLIALTSSWSLSWRKLDLYSYNCYQSPMTMILQQMQDW